MPEFSQVDTSRDRETDAGCADWDWTDLLSTICSDIHPNDATALSFLLRMTQGAFALFMRFEVKNGLYVIDQGLALPDGYPMCGRLGGRLCYEEFVRSNKPLAAYPDLMQTGYLDSDPDVKRFQLKACLGAPIRQNGQVIGALAVFDQRPRDFDDVQRQALISTAHVFGLVIDRRRLERQIALKRAHEKLLADVSAAAISTNDISFLDDCLGTLGRSLEVDEAHIFWLDAGISTFTPHKSYWRGDRLIPNSSEDAFFNFYSMPVIREVIDSLKPFLCENAALLTDEASQAAMRKNEMAAFLVLPICNERQCFGMLAMHMHNGPLKCDQEDLETFMAISGIIAQWKERLDISRELDESQALIYQLFQLSPTAIYQVDLENQRFVKVNDEVCRATGYTEQELLNMRADQILTPASLYLLQQRMHDLQAGQPISGNVEFEIQTKDGAAQWGHFHIRHLYREGKIWGANVVVHVITEQKKAQEELANYRLRLESLVEERTRELTLANQKLREEVALRKQIELELRGKTARLEEMNTAMRVLLDKRNEDRLRSEENIRVNLVQLIEPYIDRLKSSELSVAQKQLLEVIRTNLNDVIGSPMPELSAKYYIFSPGELKVANLIRKGKTTKETARMLNISPRTVESFRNSIRNKLGLKNKRVNLKTYLSAKE